MIQNKKAFREAATEIAKAKGISFKTAKRLLFSGIMNEYLKQEAQKPPQKLQGLWRQIFKQNATLTLTKTHKPCSNAGLFILTLYNILHQFPLSACVFLNIPGENGELV